MIILMDLFRTVFLSSVFFGLLLVCLLLRFFYDYVGYNVIYLIL